jgi:hypothetical protein
MEKVYVKHVRPHHYYRQLSLVHLNWKKVLEPGVHLLLLEVFLLNQHRIAGCCLDSVGKIRLVLLMLMLVAVMVKVQGHEQQ